MLPYVANSICASKHKLAQPLELKLDKIRVKEILSIQVETCPRFIGMNSVYKIKILYQPSTI